ncbi:MAG: hypothetical protein J6I97_01445 [Agathobacter sp.]|nr:hypothetical protein [Agathobacter sp.]
MMDNNFNPYTNPPEGGLPNDFHAKGTPPIRRIILKPNYFELFAMGFAIASLISCTVIYTAYMFAGLAILFALLSRGAQMKFSPRAKKSMIIGIAGIILATVIFVASFMYLMEEYGSLEGILRAGSEQMGIDFEKEFGDLFQ